MKPESMKTIFFALLLVAVSAQAKLAVQYRVSEMQGLLDFALALSDRPHLPPGFKEVYKRSELQTPEVEAAIKTMRDLSPVLNEGFIFKTPVASRPQGAAVEDILISQSIFASDLADFEQRSIGVLMPSDQVLFFGALKTIQPVFRKRIWKSGQPFLKKHRAKLEGLAKKADLNGMFEKAVKFYGARWPESLPFTIGLYSVPTLKNFRNSSNSNSLGSIEQHGVLEGKDLAGSFGVVFHELCHSVYASQTDEKMIELKKAFDDSKHPSRALAEQYLNEALATAIGNGWAYERVSDVPDKSWYNNEYIEGFAREIYPDVKEMLETGKTIDAAFINRAIEAFGRRFPQAHLAFEPMMMALVVGYDGKPIEGQELKRSLRHLYNIASYQGGSPLSEERTIEDIRESSTTALIVLTPEHMDHFQAFASKFPLLKTSFSAIKSAPVPSLFAQLDEKGRPFLIVKVKDQKSLQSALEKMKELKSIDPTKPIRALE